VTPLRCTPLFLIRIGSAFGAFVGRWLATGADPAAPDDKQEARVK
jgi:hypothetical protein